LSTFSSRPSPWQASRLLVALGATLAPFFAVQIAVGLAVVAMVPVLLGASAFVAPRFDRAEQRVLRRSALPVAAALAVGQLYFRLVIVLMSLISNPTQTGYFGLSLRAMETLIFMPILVAGVALPLLTRAAHEDPARLRNAVKGLSEGAVIAGVLIVGRHDPGRRTADGDHRRQRLSPRWRGP